MLKIDCEYKAKDDIRFFLEGERLDILEFSEKTKISRTSLNLLFKDHRVSDEILEKAYSFIYEQKYRINRVKEEILNETGGKILFHGSKSGLTCITIDGSRSNCDFGKGFYLGETYEQALSFVYEKKGSSVYSFECNLTDLKIKKFQCDLEWMLAICYFRGTLEEYSSHPKIRKIIDDLKNVDLIIAPIADNKMFYVMSQFTEGEINADAALHSLSASSLGLQYIFRTEKALKCLKPIEKYYICNQERMDCRKKMNERSFEIDTKLKLAKREFKTGMYIEEILK